MGRKLNFKIEFTRIALRDNVSVSVAAVVMYNNNNIILLYKAQIILHTLRSAVIVICVWMLLLYANGETRAHYVILDVFQCNIIAVLVYFDIIRK